MSPSIVSIQTGAVGATPSQTSDEIDQWRYEDIDTIVKLRGWPRLRHLDLADNELLSLPKHISVLRNLTHLNVNDNWLKVLPDELIYLPISTLLSAGNQLYDMPGLPQSSTAQTAPAEAPAMFTSLTRLDLSVNNVRPSLLSLNPKTILQNLASYVNLKSVDLNHSVLSHLPSALLKIAPVLTHVELSHANMRSLSAADIKAFATVKSLNLSYNGLSALPVELYTLSTLEELDISHNELSSLPHPILGLRANLKRLNASYNTLKSVPGPICTLINLDVLLLSGNRLEDSVLESIMPLTALKRLELSNNLLTKFPTSMSSLQQLTRLSIGGNALQNVDALPFFSKLEELDLDQAPTLNSLPKRVSELSELRLLHVGNATMEYDTTHSSKRKPRNYGQHQRQVSVTIHNAQALGLVQLISFIRTCPHELLLGGMTQLCNDPQWHAKLLAAGVINEFSYLLFASEVPAAQLRTLQAIKTLCKNPGNHNFIGIDETVATAVADLIQTNLAKAATDRRANLLLRHAIDAFAYLSYDPRIRRKLYHLPTAHSVAQLLQGISPTPHSTTTEVDAKKSESSSSPTPITSSDAPGTTLQQTSDPSVASSQPEPPQIQITPTGDAPKFADWDSEYGLNGIMRYLASLEDPHLSARAKRTMAGLGIAPKLKNPDGGVRILSIDGGGTRGFIVILMFAIIEQLTGKTIRDNFDLMVGTSTGGLISGIAAWSPITLEEAKPYYRTLCRHVFTPKGYNVPPHTTELQTRAPLPVSTLFGADDEDDSIQRVHSSTTDLSQLNSSEGISRSLADSTSSASEPPPPQQKRASTQNKTEASSRPSTPQPHAHDSSAEESRWLSSAPWQRFTALISMIQTGAYYETHPIENILKEMTGDHVSLLDTAMLSDTKFAVVSTRANVHPVSPFVLRNYNHPPDAANVANGTCNLRVWECLRATSAAPGYFDPFVKDDLNLIDGALSHNNPVAIAIAEAKALWPNAPISCIVSCGTGTREPRPVDVTMGQLMSTLVDSATETEKTAYLMNTVMPKGTYFRIQPLDDVFDFPIDEVRPERFDQMEAFMTKWLEENGDLFFRIAEALKSKPAKN